MATLVEIIAEVNALQSLSDDLFTKSAASHSAVQAVADTTATQNALVQKAQSDANVAINSAQTAADVAVKATADAQKAIDDAIAKIEADLESLKSQSH